MGKLVVNSCGKQHRPSSSSSSMAVAGPAGYLTLRSGRHVPAAAAACSPRTMSRSQCRRGGSSELRRCGNNTRRKGAAGVRQRYRVVSSQLVTGGDRSEQEEAPEKAGSTVDRDHGCCGDHRQHTLLISGEASSKQHLYSEANSGAADQLMTRSSSPPPEAEMEAFFAAAELAERRRFVETYNYDVALDRPLEGRFEWTPVST